MMQCTVSATPSLLLGGALSARSAGLGSLATPMPGPGWGARPGEVRRGLGLQWDADTGLS